jgi:hypothetical protein
MRHHPELRRDGKKDVAYSPLFDISTMFARNRYEIAEICFQAQIMGNLRLVE